MIFLKIITVTLIITRINKKSMFKQNPDTSFLEIKNVEPIINVIKASPIEWVGNSGTGGADSGVINTLS